MAELAEQVQQPRARLAVGGLERRVADHPALDLGGDRRHRPDHRDAGKDLAQPRERGRREHRGDRVACAAELLRGALERGRLHGEHDRVGACSASSASESDRLAARRCGERGRPGRSPRRRRASPPALARPRAQPRASAAAMLPAREPDLHTRNLRDRRYRHSRGWRDGEAPAPPRRATEGTRRARTRAPSSEPGPAASRTG